MARYRDIDLAVEHLSTHAAREQWREFRRAHLLFLLGPMPGKFGLEVDALFDEVHRHGHVHPMIGFVEEATLSAAVAPGQPSILDDYLKRRGWQETPRGRAYLQGIGSSVPSLYEVQGVAPGEWIDLRDRLRDVPVVRVMEQLGSQHLKRWDCLVGRVMAVRDEHMLSAGTLALNRSTAEAIEARLAKERGGSTESTALLLQMWLDGLLTAARRPLPTLQNTDGEPMLFATTRLKFKAADREEVERRLDALDGWTRDAPGEPAWTRSSSGRSGPGTVLASLRIERAQLLLDTNSQGRLERAIADLQTALGELVGRPMTSIEDAQVALREQLAAGGPRRGQRKGKGMATEDPGMSPAEMQAVVHRFKEQHYRRTLDEIVPMLGNKTPRQCTRSKAGRQKLMSWLKELENGELRQAANQGMAPMDFGWMWEELGLTRE